MQVNYYSDQDCTQYMNSLDIHQGDLDVCLGWNIPGAGSFNIANCYSSGACVCQWSTGDTCGQGDGTSTETTSDYSIATCGNTATTIWEPVYILFYFVLASQRRNRVFT
jgi:hypothetical protein